MRKFVSYSIICSIIAISSCYTGNTFATTEKYLSELKKYKKITPADLGPFSLSVKKFSSKTKLDAHHEELLKKAEDTNLSPIQRYSYALLLGINHANNETRAMAIIALKKLIDDPNLSPRDKHTIIAINNLIIYSSQNKTGLD